MSWRRVAVSQPTLLEDVLVAHDDPDLGLTVDVGFMVADGAWRLTNCERFIKPSHWRPIPMHPESIGVSHAEACL